MKSSTLLFIPFKFLKMAYLSKFVSS